MITDNFYIFRILKKGHAAGSYTVPDNSPYLLPPLQISEIANIPVDYYYHYNSPTWTQRTVKYIVHYGTVVRYIIYLPQPTTTGIKK